MLSRQHHNCYCGSGESFNTCCEKYINEKQFPSTSEQLMRSRYSAYVLKNENYLLNSWHSSTRPSALNLKSDSTSWKKLKVISSSNNSVEFVAYYTEAEEIFFLYERSKFIFENNWYYLQGEELKTMKVSKNMSCPCDSGKKFKRCCATEILI